MSVSSTMNGDLPLSVFDLIAVLNGQFRINADGAVVGDCEGGFVGGDGVDEDFYCVVGDEDEVDRRALGAGLSGYAVEGVDARGCADARYFRAVGKNLGSLAMENIKTVACLTLVL